MNYNYDKNNLNFILFCHGIFLLLSVVICHFVGSPRPDNNESPEVGMPLQGEPK